MAAGWKNPLWRSPENWVITGKGGRPAARPSEVADKLAALMTRARLCVSQEASRPTRSRA